MGYIPRASVGAGLDVAARSACNPARSSRVPGQTANWVKITVGPTAVALRAGSGSHLIEPQRALLGAFTQPLPLGYHGVPGIAG
jgi:hypothetical protein